MALFIGRLDFDARKEDLEDLFNQYGKISRCDVKRGYGFVEFDDKRDAEDAIKACDGSKLLSTRIVVEWAKGENKRARPSECFKCGRDGHFARDCPDGSSSFGGRRGGFSRRSRSRSRPSRRRSYSRGRRSRSRSRSRSRDRISSSSSRRVDRYRSRSKSPKRYERSRSRSVSPASSRPSSYYSRNRSRSRSPLSTSSGYRPNAQPSSNSYADNEPSSNSFENGSSTSLNANIPPATVSELANQSPESAIQKDPTWSSSPRARRAG